MNSLSQNAALLLIDVQKGLDNAVYGERNNPQAEDNMARLLAAWRAAGRAVYHVQHLSVISDSPLREGLPGCEIKEFAKPLPGEPLFQKHVNSAFIGTNLEQHLRKQGNDTLIIVGLTTEHCVSTTTRMASNLGFNVVLVADATASYDATGYDGHHYTADQVHTISLATLHGEFCTVVETDNLLLSL